jgi:hypothetical protein
MDDCGDLNDIGLDSVDNAAVLEYQFRQIRSAIFRGKQGQLV